MTDGMHFNRRAPALLLGLVLAVLALHHWFVVTQHSAVYIVLFLFPPFGMLALGGLIYPPILRSLGEDGKTLRAWVRAVGVLLAVIGLGIGVYLFKVVYRF